MQRSFFHGARTSSSVGEAILKCRWRSCDSSISHLGPPAEGGSNLIGKFPVALVDGISIQLHLRLFRAKEVDQSRIEGNQFTTVTVLELPFRLRLGQYFRANLGNTSGVEVVVLNQIPIPRKESYRITELSTVEQRPLLNSRIAVIQSPSVPSDEELAEIRDSGPIPTFEQARKLLLQPPDAQVMIFPELTRTLKQIQSFIEIYYYSCAPTILGHGVRPVWIDDLISGQIVFATCLLSPGEKIPDRFLRVLLNSQNPRRQEKDMSWTHLKDDSPGDRRKFRKRLRSDSPELSEKLLFLSDSYAAQHNHQMALITAVAAMEAGVSLFARARMDKVLEPGLTSSLLREQGMMTMIEVIPRLFFSNRSWPDRELLEQVKKAISARNDIMHGKNTQKGKPKILEKKDGEIANLTYACRLMIEALARETEYAKKQAGGRHGKSTP